MRRLSRDTEDERQRGVLMDAWIIDGRSVSKAEYERLRKKLKATGEGWYCKKTPGGGRTGHEAKAPDGTLYVVEAVTDSAGGRQSITRKK